MLINGEKWACDACVRGHRVSNCQHADRPLQHINKKGRPVSQCQHCRTMRKSRASHVKCDCGEKTHKCTHLSKGADGHRESCCCNHGGRCTCSHKKDQPALDTVPESEDDEETATAKCGSAKTGSWGRRRANTIHSDGALTFDENGHHKPAHKHAKASRKSGPYQLDRVNSLNNVDSMRNRSIDNFFPSAAARDAGSDGAQSSCCGTDRSRKVKSEAASPLMTGSSALAQLNGQLPALDLSSLDYTTYLANSQDAYGNFSEHDQPIFSAGLSAASVDWSHYEGLEMASKSAENLAPSNYSQTQSYGGVEFNGSEQVPTLTTATSASGDLSESDDLVINCVDSLDFDTGFQASTNSSGFNLHQIQTDVLGTTDLTALEYDEFLKAGSRFLSASPEEQSLPPTDAMASGSFSLDDESALWMSDYTHGLPLLSDPVDPGMPSFWDAQ